MEAQRLAVLDTLFPPESGRLVDLLALKDFAQGRNAERTLMNQRSLRIGNAVQNLHPLAGQGLKLGLRDAHGLVAALGGAPDIACCSASGGRARPTAGPPSPPPTCWRAASPGRGPARRWRKVFGAR